MCDTYHGMYTAVPLYVKGDTLINPHGGPHRQLKCVGQVPLHDATMLPTWQLVGNYPPWGIRWGGLGSRRQTLLGLPRVRTSSQNTPPSPILDP